MLKAKSILGLIAALAVVIASPAGASESLMDSMIEVRGGVQLATQSHAPRMIIAIEYNSNHRGGLQPTLCYKAEGLCFLSISGEVAIDDLDGNVAAYDFDIVPIEHVPSGLRAMRTEIRRDLALGEESSVSIYLVGWETETILGPFLANVARVAVDAIGLQHLLEAETGEFLTGIKFGQAETEIALYLDDAFGPGMSLNVVWLGARANLGLVKGAGGSQLTFDVDRYSSIEVAMKTAYGTFGIFTEIGFHARGRLGAEADSAEDYDYLKVGVSGTY